MTPIGETPVTALPGLITDTRNNFPITAVNGAVYVQSFDTGSEIGDIYRVNADLTVTNITNRFSLGYFRALYSLKANNVNDREELYALLEVGSTLKLHHVDVATGNLTEVIDASNVITFTEKPVGNSLKFVTGTNLIGLSGNNLVYFDPRMHGVSGPGKTISLDAIQNSGPEVDLFNITFSAADDNFLYFPANNSLTGTELWRVDIDDLPAVTSTVIEILPGSASAIAPLVSSQKLILIGDTVYFTATGGPEGEQLWRYVPGATRTAIGTLSRVLDVNQNGIGGITQLIELDDELLVQRGADTWRFDGIALVRLATGTVNASALVNSSPQNDSTWLLHNFDPFRTSLRVARYAPENAGYIFGGQDIVGGLPLLASSTSVDINAAEFTFNPLALGLGGTRFLAADVFGDLNGDDRDDVVFTSPGNLAINREPQIVNDVATRNTVVRPENPANSLDALLASVGLANDDAFESAANSFKVVGSGGTEQLTFTLRSDAGDYNFTFGFYITALVPFDPITERVQYAASAINQAINFDFILFNDFFDDPGATITREVAVGNEIGFFLIPNGTPDDFIADPELFYLTNDAPLFSFPNANPGELDQMLAFVGNGKTFFTFEDLSRAEGNNNSAGNSDNNFVDVSFEVNRSLVGAGGLELHPLGDVNNDGFDDVAVRNGRDLGIVFGAEVLSSMNFESPDQIIRGSGDFSQISVTAGDFNADGQADLAVVDTATDRTLIYNSIASLGNLIPQSASTTQLLGTTPTTSLPLGFEFPVTGTINDTVPRSLMTTATGRTDLVTVPVTETSFQIEFTGTKAINQTLGGTVISRLEPFAFNQTIAVSTVATDTLATLVTKLNAQLATTSLSGLVTASAVSNRLSFTAIQTSVELTLRVREFATTTFTSLANTPQLDLNDDGIDDLLIRSIAAASVVNSEVENAGRIYTIYGTRTKRSLPTTFDVLENISVPGSGSFVVDRGTGHPQRFNAGGETAYTIGAGADRWFRFSTLGDGKSGDSIRISTTDVNAFGLKADLIAADGSVLKVGQTIFDLRATPAGTYFLRVYDTQGPKNSFVIDVAAPVRGQTHETSSLSDRDFIFGGDGDDTIFGNNDLDQIFAGSGADRVTAEPIEVREHDIADRPLAAVISSETSFGNNLAPLDPSVLIVDSVLKASIGFALGEPVTLKSDLTLSFNNSSVFLPTDVLQDRTNLTTEFWLNFDRSNPAEVAILGASAKLLTVWCCHC